MKNMTVIPPKPQKGNAAAKEEVKRLRVAAYCRVSTDNEELFISFVDSIIVYSRDSVGFKLKCGLTLKEALCTDTRS